jgi:hypothetical protein
MEEATDSSALNTGTSESDSSNHDESEEDSDSGLWRLLERVCVQRTLENPGALITHIDFDYEKVSR